MDRVSIPNEKPGSATYYMGMAPEEYGASIYEMEHYGDATIRRVMMDIGKSRTQPHVEIRSRQEFDDLIWKTQGVTVYSCRFEITSIPKNDAKPIDVMVIIDFISKRITLEVDPTKVWDQKQKSHLADFFNILTEPDYYEVKELERIEEELQIPNLFKTINILAFIVFAATMSLDLLGVFDDESAISSTVPSLINGGSLLYICGYRTFVEIMKCRLKK